MTPLMKPENAQQIWLKLVTAVTPICSPECPPHIPALLLAVTQKVSKMAGVDMRADGDEEMLIELKGTWELLRQLPHTLQELIDDRRLLLRIAVQVSVPAGTTAAFRRTDSNSELRRSE